jgi:hypothetical protein
MQLHNFEKDHEMAENVAIEFINANPTNLTGFL